MRIRAFFGPAVVLGMVVACGGGESRDFASGTGGAAGSSGAGGSSATGGSSGTGATGGTSGTGGSGGLAGSGTGGSSATGGSAGAGGATGGTGGATGGTGGATGGTGGVAACDTTSHICAPPAPAAWTGPVAFHHGANAPPACPGNYPTKGTDAYMGLTPGAASCACSCNPATGITGCNTASIYDVPNTVIGCTTNPSQSPLVWTGGAGACVKATGNSTGNVALVVSNPTSQGSCTAKSNHTLPTPTWAQQTRVCSGGTASANTCNAGQTCMPKAFAPYELCVYRPGDVACPANGYTKKALVYDSFQDTRACSACSCGSATSSCKGKVDMVSGCGSLPISFSQVSGCGAPTQDITSSQYGIYTAAPTGTCPASASTLAGTVTAGGEATVCCLP